MREACGIDGVTGEILDMERGSLAKEVNQSNKPNTGESVEQSDDITVWN